MSSSFLQGDGERRNYFRINDEIFLNYRHLAPGESPTLPKSRGETINDCYSLTALFTSISRQTQLLNRQIRTESPAVADYFNAVEQKLDLLARMLLLQQMDMNPGDTGEVNLSGGGVEFRTDEAVSPGCMLEMKIVVFPSHTGILTSGQVMRCQHEKTNTHPYRVAVEFVHIREADRQFIIKHVLGKQSIQIREHKRELNR